MTADTDLWLSQFYMATQRILTAEAFFSKINKLDAMQMRYWLILSVIYYRDVQASSVLLDDKFDVRLGSLSEVCPQEGEGRQNVITKLLRFSS